MLVTFKCSAYADITMFGDVAKKMLEMMGFGSRVPGAIRVEDVPRALENLRRGLATVPDQPQPAGDEDDEEPTTSLHTRALPLLELLQAAIADESRVRWE
jgi:hypothetical protein